MDHVRVHARRFAGNGFLDQFLIEGIFSLPIGLRALPPRHRSRDSIEEWQDVDDTGGRRTEADELGYALHEQREVRSTINSRQQETRLASMTSLRSGSSPVGQDSPKAAASTMLAATLLGESTAIVHNTGVSHLFMWSYQPLPPSSRRLTTFNVASNSCKGSVLPARTVDMRPAVSLRPMKWLSPCSQTPQ